jgi:cell division septum initiation protein DivIVA
MIEKSYGEMQAEISMLKKENQELQERVLSLKMAVQTLEAFLKPVAKNCGSGCSCRKQNSDNL